MIDRRKFLRAALFVAAAPVIVKASSLMPIRAARYTWVPMFEPLEYTEPNPHLLALIRSMEETKIMIGAQVLNGTYDYSQHLNYGAILT